jgi:hypothetical protein
MFDKLSTFWPGKRVLVGGERLLSTPARSPSTLRRRCVTRSSVKAMHEYGNRLSEE